MKIEVTRSGKAERCVFCRDTLEGSPSEPEACPDCGVAFHAECRAELRRCPSFGCPGLSRRVRASDPAADEATTTRRRRRPRRRELAWRPREAEVDYRPPLWDVIKKGAGYGAMVLGGLCAWLTNDLLVALAAGLVGATLGLIQAILIFVCGVRPRPIDKANWFTAGVAVCVGLLAGYLALANPEVLGEVWGAGYSPFVGAGLSMLLGVMGGVAIGGRLFGFEQ